MIKHKFKNDKEIKSHLDSFFLKHSTYSDQCHLKRIMGKTRDIGQPLIDYFPNKVAEDY